MQDDRIQGILFNQDNYVNLAAISAVKRRKLGLKTLVNKYNIQSWRQRSAKAAMPRSPYIVVHKGRAHNSELGRLAQNLKIEILQD
jgi:hypothetical protein